MINLDAQFMISLVACILMYDRINQSRNELKCGNFWRYFFNQHIINRQARYSFPCNKLHATIYDFLRSVHLDARQNQSRNEIKCGDFWKYFFNQRIINSQARYSFRATSCTLRFMISCVVCILMHDQTPHGTLFNPLSGIHNFMQQVARYGSIKKFKNYV